MTRDQRRRLVQLRLRQTHRKLFDLQGQAIGGLRDALDAVSRTHDEMLVLFEADDDLEDLANEDNA